MKKYFITATDTDAGKTFFACALVTALTQTSVSHLKNINAKVSAYKPISAGCTLESGQLVNEDAALLLAASNMKLSLPQINPIAFEPPIAPHIAAELAGTPINFNMIQNAYDKLCSLDPDYLITEGAGGWRLPLGNGKYLSEFVKQTQQDVILVVNMKLGCLNHAILTYQSIIHDGLRCVGWVANAYETMPYLNENIAELKALLPIPLLAEFECEVSVNSAAEKIDLAPLL